jgi:gas vesicle protein
VTTSSSDSYRRGAADNPDTGNGTIDQKMKDDIQDMKSEMSSVAREKAEAGQQQIREGADALSDAIDAAASNLDEHDLEGLARYARKVSSDIASAAEHIEGRSVDELARDAKRLARNNPALFMLGSVAVGFGLSRFFKATADRDHTGDRLGENTRHSDSYRANGVSNDMSSQRPMTNAPGTSTSPYSDGRSTL